MRVTFLCLQVPVPNGHAHGAVHLHRLRSVSSKDSSLLALPDPLHGTFSIFMHVALTYSSLLCCLWPVPEQLMRKEATRRKRVGGCVGNGGSGEPDQAVHACVVRRPAQFAEETKRADKVVPWGIVLSVVGTAVLGFSYLLTLLFCIQARGPAACPLSPLCPSLLPCSPRSFTSLEASVYSALACVWLSPMTPYSWPCRSRRTLKWC